MAALKSDKWALDITDFHFSQRQCQYKAGKELEKDGQRGHLFFYLATPKQDHYMVHGLALSCPTDYDGGAATEVLPGNVDFGGGGGLTSGSCVRVHPVAVDPDGHALKDINLLVFDSAHDRFVHTLERPHFPLRRCGAAPSEVRYRIETPSKCNMGKAFCVVYEVREPATGQVLCRSRRTDPVYVQTKRGGTTAVPAAYAATAPAASAVAAPQPSPPPPPPSPPPSLAAAAAAHAAAGSQAPHEQRRGSVGEASDAKLESVTSVAGGKQGDDASRSTVQMLCQAVEAAAAGAGGGRAGHPPPSPGHEHRTRHRKRVTSGGGGGGESPSRPGGPKRTRGSAGGGSGTVSRATSGAGEREILRSLEALHHKMDAIGHLLAATSRHCLDQQLPAYGGAAGDAALRRRLRDVEDALAMERRSGGTGGGTGGGGGGADPGADLDGGGDGGDGGDGGGGLTRQTSLGLVRLSSLRADDVRAGVASLTTLMVAGHHHGAPRHHRGKGSGGASRGPSARSPSSHTSSSSSAHASQDDISDALILTSICRPPVPLPPPLHPPPPEVPLPESNELAAVASEAGVGEGGSGSRGDSAEEKDVEEAQEDTEEALRAPAGESLGETPLMSASQEEGLFLSQLSMSSTVNEGGDSGEEDLAKGGGDSCPTTDEEASACA